MEAQKPTYDDLAPGGDDGLWLWRGKPPNPTQLRTPTGSRKLRRSRRVTIGAWLRILSSEVRAPRRFPSPALAPPSRTEFAATAHVHQAAMMHHSLPRRDGHASSKFQRTIC